MIFRSFILGLCLVSAQAYADQDINSKADLLDALEKNGPKVGAVVWLKYPMNDVNFENSLPGLTKITIKDVDVREQNGGKYIILVAKVDGKNDFDIMLSAGTHLYGSIADRFYLTDPRKTTAKWGKKALNAIAEGHIFIGMTREQVMASVGQPTDSHRTVDSSGQHEQFVIGNSIFLYFDNGRLSSWQN